MKRVALYCRVSTPEQHLDNQLFQLRELAAKRGYTIVKEYTDKMSGAKARRPGLDALMADARCGKFDLVFVAAFDRIARSVSHFLQVLDELENVGVEFSSAREAIDTSGAMGRLFLTLIGAVCVKGGVKPGHLGGVKVGQDLSCPPANPLCRTRNNRNLHLHKVI
jgi:DNA invertase Pin-like site-specific DNA recombinase